MKSDLWALSPYVAVEPLIDGWSAWLMLLDPVSRGFYDSHHQDLLASYLAMPERHLRAVSDPRLRGGPFCELGGVPLAEVSDFKKSHFDATRRHIEFSEALCAASQTVDPLSYESLPDVLKGRVELTDGADGRRQTRPLIGAAPVSNMASAAVWNRAGERPALLSTPRISKHQGLSHATGSWLELAELASLHHRPLPIRRASEICETVGIAPAEVLVADEETDELTQKAHLHGHAAVGLPLSPGWLICDPIPPTSTRSARRLREVTVVLITHCHPDHLNLEALLALVPQQPTVVVPGARRTPLDPAPAPLLRSMGSRDVIETWPYDQVELGGATVLTLPFVGEHGDLPISARATFGVRTKTDSVLLAADSTGATDLPPEFVRTYSDLVIGIETAGADARWLYGPVIDQLGLVRKRSRPMAGATASQVIDLARSHEARSITICGRGAPGMEHIFSRPSGNPSRVDDELAALRRMAADKELLVSTSGCEKDWATEQ